MSADDENPHDDKPLEDEAMNVTGDHPNQTQEPAPINEEKNPGNEEGQFEAENNEENLSASEVNNVQIENTDEENSAKTVKRSRLKLILPLYLIGLISLSIAALGFCFAPFTEYVHDNYKFVPTSNFLWVWICAIISGAVFLVDLVVVLSLKGAKRIGSLKKLFLARFSLPLAASVIVCIIVGLVGGINYRNYYKAEEIYITNDTKITTPIASPTNIIGEAYNQCYPTGDNYVSGNYQTDAYETSIQNLNTAGSSSLSNTANVLTEFGCVLDALNINKQSGQSTMATLINNALNSQSNDANTHIGPYYIYIFFYYSSNNANETDAWFNIANNNMKGYKYNTSVLPAMSTINSSASFVNFHSEAVDILTDVLNSGSVPTSLSNTSQQENSSTLNGSSSTPSSASENLGNSVNSNSNYNATNDMNNAAMCSEDEDEAEIPNNATLPNNVMQANPGPGGNVQSIVVNGTGPWGKMMACLASTLQMPINVENKLKEYIDKGTSAPSDQSFDKEERTYLTSWPLTYGTILLTYDGPVDNTTGGWAAEFQPSI